MNESTRPTEISEERAYVVIDVVETEPPREISSGTWYRYTIGHRSSPITGIRAGSLNSVRRYAEEFAENLNQRLQLGFSAYAARKLQKK